MQPQAQRTANQSVHTAGEIPLQPTSLDIWGSKYRLTTKEGVAIDETVDDTFVRVAKALSDVEATPELRSHWNDRFLDAMRRGAVPAGRILSNAGALEHKPATSTINCTVSRTIGDSMHDILMCNYEAGMTLRAGCGIGYDFSTLRPAGAFVAGAGAYTSGPLSFMDIFDKTCFTVASAGGRRGAQMATFDVGHPDAPDFIRAKREDGRFRQFNLSLLITDEFIDAVKADATWKFAFPVLRAEAAELDFADPDQVIWREWPHHYEGYTIRDDGLVACKVYKTMPARELWDLIMASTYDYAEPGFILIDRVNEMNNNWWCENIRATNPCGEQPLPPGGSCLLGSVNLTRFVLDPFTDRARFDWDGYREVVGVFCRLLDNVVELNGLPLELQREEILSKRRHGMGYLGLGSTLAMLQLRYGSQESVAFTEEVTRTMAVQGWKVGVELAREKGAAPLLEQSYTVDGAMLRKRPEMVADGYKVGDTIEGKVLHARYSRYMQRIAQYEPELVAEMAQVGCRYTHHSSIAPTGTISLSLGNNASNGVEPSFAHHYRRNVIVAGRKSKDQVDVFSYELLAYRAIVDADAAPDHPDPAHQLPAYFVDSGSITPAEHVAVQAAAQSYIDSAISKTVNIDTDCPFDAFKDVYLQAHASGLKGCTTYRPNPAAYSGVLVKNEDLAKTTYEFTLEDGTKVRARGDEAVEYDGQTHTAANLFEALKDGYYGKHH